MIITRWTALIGATLFIGLLVRDCRGDWIEVSDVIVNRSFEDPGFSGWTIDTETPSLGSPIIDNEHHGVVPTHGDWFFNPRNATTTESQFGLEWNVYQDIPRTAFGEEVWNSATAWKVAVDALGDRDDKSGVVVGPANGSYSPVIFTSDADWGWQPLEATMGPALGNFALRIDLLGVDTGRSGITDAGFDNVRLFYRTGVEAVPEPSGLLLAALCVPWFCLRRRRR